MSSLTVRLRSRVPSLPPQLWWPAALLALALAAFFPTYFGLFPGFPGTSVAVHFHVATMLAWLLLGISQPLLIRRRQIALHRSLGRVVYLLLPLIALGFWGIVRDGQLRQKEPELILATAFDGGLFLLLAGLGVWHRKRRELHGPFMLLSLLPFLNPTLGRLIAPGAGVPVELIVIVALLVRARRQRRTTRPYLVALVAFVVGLIALGTLMGAAPGVAETLHHWLV